MQNISYLLTDLKDTTEKKNLFIHFSSIKHGDHQLTDCGEYTPPPFNSTEIWKKTLNSE